MIYHIATSEDWNLHLNSPTYVPGGYEHEGFIHCSTKDQVQGVLERYYAGVKNLFLLHIDESMLTVELKYEVSTHGALFPHLFGAMNKNAIVKVENL